MYSVTFSKKIKHLEDEDTFANVEILWDSTIFKNLVQED